MTEGQEQILEAYGTQVMPDAYAPRPRPKRAKPVIGRSSWPGQRANGL